MKGPLSEEIRALDDLSCTFWLNNRFWQIGRVRCFITFLFHISFGSIFTILEQIKSLLFRSLRDNALTNFLSRNSQNYFNFFILDLEKMKIRIFIRKTIKHELSFQQTSSSVQKLNTNFTEILLIHQTLNNWNYKKQNALKDAKVCNVVFVLLRQMLIISVFCSGNMIL